MMMGSRCPLCARQIGRCEHWQQPIQNKLDELRKMYAEALPFAPETKRAARPAEPKEKTWPNL